jgi:hypothetical protein
MFFACAPARADLSRPNEATKPAFVALLHSRLLGVRPDFESWVARAPSAPKFPTDAEEKAMKEQAKELAATFDMLTGLDPIYIDTYVSITGYDARKDAYFIQSFDKYAFYSYVHLGRSYAVIPHGIDAYQWLRLRKGTKDLVWAETQQGKKAHIRLTLIPRAADPRPMAVGGRNYRLLMANVLKAELWSKDDSHVIWDDADNQTSGVKHMLREFYR